MEPRITTVTLGVTDLQRSFKFYHEGLGFSSKDGIEGDIAFFQLNHMLLALYPRDLLAKDANVPDDGSGFSGMTLAHNVKSKQEVDVLIEHVRRSGAKITKEPQDTFWGGYDAYFQDPDGFLWEIAWAPQFWVE